MLQSQILNLNSFSYTKTSSSRFLIPSLLLSIVWMSLLLGGCSSSASYYRFSKGQTPNWTQKSLFTERNRLYVVGVSPTTFEVQEDLDLAHKDAQVKLSQYFSSEVQSKVSIWSLSGSASGEELDEESSELDVEVSSQIRVEQTRIIKKFREAQSKTQYVLVSLDQGKWLKQLKKRLNKVFKKTRSLMKKLKKELKSKNHLNAYAYLQRAAQQIQHVNTDLVVIQLLQEKNQYDQKVEQIKKALENYDQKIKSTSPFYLKIESRSGALGARLKKQALGNLTNFINRLGFQVQAETEGKGVQVKMKIEQAFVNQEQIGARTSFVHAAAGSIQVYDVNGKEKVDLAVNLGNQSYTEADADQQEAMKKALKLSKDRLLAKWRSLFRNQYVNPEED